jgi:opacity protein-like surface antigen
MYRMLVGAALAAISTSAFAADYVQQEPVAAPHISGHVEAYLGGIWLHVSDPFGGGGSESEDGWAAGAAGRVNFPLNERWNIQTDAIVDSAWIDGENVYGYGGAVHAYWRDPSRFAVGGFATYTRYGGDGIGDTNPYSYTFGPEAQIYFGNVTLYGQAYYGQLENSFFGDLSADLWGVRAVLRYYARPDLRFDAELGYQKLEFDTPPFVPTPNLSTFAAAAQVTYRFSGTPWSVFGRYQFEHVTQEVGPISLDANIHKVMVGLRLNFGTGTLLDEDRNGATMDTVRPSAILY